jgi:hypothetical protein
MPLSEKPPYVLGSDGLPVRVSGLWAKRKHHYLRNYCGITTNAVKAKLRGGVVYLDVMAGPGRCLEEANSDEFPGRRLSLSTSILAATFLLKPTGTSTQPSSGDWRYIQSKTE